jgi:hypothetical protein
MSAGQADVTCPECGATNPAGAVHCAECGERLASHGRAASVWSRPVAAKGDDATDVIDLVPRSSISSQATTPIPNGDWNNGGARPLAPGESPESTWTSSPPPVRPPSPPVQPKPGGPPGCVLGCLGLLIVLAVAVVFVYSVGRPYLRDRVGDRISEGIATQVGAIPQVTVTSAGRITLTNADINNAIHDYTGSIDPISDPVATIDRTGIHIKFKVYGTSSEFSGLPVVAAGRIVLLKPKISGVAGRVVDTDAIVSMVEDQLAALMSRSGLTPTSIVLGDGSLSVVTTTNAGNTV